MEASYSYVIATNVCFLRYIITELNLNILVLSNYAETKDYMMYAMHLLLYLSQMYNHFRHLMKVAN